MNSTVDKQVLENRTSITSEILNKILKKVDNNTIEIKRNKMALNFGCNNL